MFNLKLIILSLILILTTGCTSNYYITENTQNTVSNNNNNNNNNNTLISISAIQSGTQSITANTETKLLLQVEEWDLQNNFDNGTFTAPRNALYQVTGAISYQVTADTDRIRVLFYVNGVKVSNRFLNSGSDAFNTVVLTQVLNLSINDTLELYAINADNDDNVAKSGTFFQVHSLN